ncbi:MAG: branched-chain amino acid ABC transporter permease [Bacteroidota bacterium]
MAKHDVTLTAPPPPAANGTAGQSRPASRQMLFVLALLALSLAAPLGVYPVFLMKGLCFALFASAFNLLLGFVGLLSFGHAMFFGWSAYVTAHAAKEWGLTPELAILAGVALSAAMGAVVGWLAIRRQGIYFAMITLALAQLVFFLAVQAPFTHGEDGIQGVPRGHLFGLIDLSNMYAMYYFVLAVFVAALLFLYRVVHSPFGQVLKAIRDNEPRAISLGYHVERAKLVAFVLSAALAGLAGSVKSLVFQLASLADVHWHTSGEVVLMTLLGGVGTLFGPTVGAFLVVTIQNYFSEAGSWVTIIQGVIFVVCVLAFRSGLVGVLAPWLKKRGIQA